jgi:DNA-binding protein H-NS
LTWTGRGRAPLWMVELESNGKSRSELLIAN